MKASDKKPCKAMKGLIAEGQEAIKEISAGPVRDAALIASRDSATTQACAGHT